MDLSGLNKMQARAVQHTEGPLLVVAGAGSGKTRVLTHRIAYLIEEKSVFSSSILAITFTNKAANEMKGRIAALIGENSYGMWVGTFHAICVRILRRDAELIGFKSNFTIYDTSDQKALIKQCLKDLNIDDKLLPVKLVQAKLSLAKNEMLYPEKYEKIHGGDFKEDQFIKVYNMYQKRLKLANAMDFDDLLLQTINLFETSDEVLTYYNNRFKYIHVDEYQDTNKAQYTLIRQITEGYNNICVVGDGDQSIYAWRGADIRNIHEFERDFRDATVIKLEQNYRSSKKILEAANGVIKNNASRKPKKLWTDNDEGEDIHYRLLNSETEEARFVASKIISNKGMNHRKFSDYAILYRTNAQSRTFEDALMREGLPYKILGGTKFYDRKEIKDIMAYMRVVENPADSVSLLRVLNAPKRGIGAKSVENLISFSETIEGTLMDALLEAESSGLFTKKVLNGFKTFLDSVYEFSQYKENFTVLEILEGVMERSGYLTALKAEETVEAQARIDNIMELKSVVMEFSKRSEEKTLEAFLAETSLRSDVDGLDEDEEKDSILLMTLHSAKGLEFPVVFLVGLEEGLFPSARSMETEEDVEEERRLCYVGITRAEEELFLTNARLRTMYGRASVNEASRFLGELPEDIIDGDDPKTRVRGTVSVGGSIRPQVKVIEKKREVKEGDYKPGTKVKHKGFGVGTIISVKNNGDDKVLTIAFDSKGIKKLQLSFAPLEILE